MAEKVNPYKQTSRRGRTKFTTLLPLDHPVVLGVFEAEKVLGGLFPSHVREIRVLPDDVPGSRGTHLNGTCEYFETGGSKITIYAGSISHTSGGHYLDQEQARQTTLHEVGHSLRADEIASGVWLDLQPGQLDGPQWETDADSFATNSVTQFYQRNRKPGPRMTMRQLLEQRGDKTKERK